MININFNPNTFELEVNGHAEQDEKGKDIVCAAISILFYTLGQNLIDSAEMLEGAPMVRDEDGNGYIRCTPKAEYEGNIACIYRTILVGMQMVEEEYKNYVVFSVVG